MCYGKYDKTVCMYGIVNKAIEELVITNHWLYLHYCSKRRGLKEFERGLLYGLAALYNTPVTVKEINDPTGAGSQAVFSISW